MSTAKRSAASRKAWRTRKHMKEARAMESDVILGAMLDSITMPAAEDVKPPDAWPEYMRRALPLPEFGK